jgi:hypothetical protein
MSFETTVELTGFLIAEESEARIKRENLSLSNCKTGIRPLTTPS